MEPHVPEKLSLDLSSSLRLKLLRVYNASGADGWKMYLLFIWVSIFL